VKVQLLGTGSAEGWPNPFCDCASCSWARTHEVRGQSAALVDDELLIDCGPEIPRAATRLGISLSRVRTMLLTHAHPDHLGPQALWWRSWGRTAGPLQIIGPPAALDVCRPYLEPDDPVELVAVSPGDVVAAVRHRVTALAATHGGPEIGPAVLFDVDHTLLYATDTGPLGEQTLTALATDYAAVLLEETLGTAAPTPGHAEHHDLAAFGETVAELRRRRAINDATRVIAIHLGHGNPPGPELARRLASWGAELHPDGTVLDLPDRGLMSPPPELPPRRVLVTGGTRSGKSLFAEQQLAAEPAVQYVATAPPMPTDDEWSRRIAHHRDRRPATWVTVETGDLAALLARPGPPLLIDCLTLWLSREEVWADEQAVETLVAAWQATSRTVIAVTNEVGSGIVPATASGRAFRDALGRLNAAVARASDEVWLVVAGIPQQLR
jgi:adenosylcobinamide kinase/adenosylcobinamide-phosphate guanylyltransferase